MKAVNVVYHDNQIADTCMTEFKCFDNISISSFLHCEKLHLELHQKYKYTQIKKKYKLINIRNNIHGDSPVCNSLMRLILSAIHGAPNSSSN